MNGLTPSSEVDVFTATPRTPERLDPCRPGVGLLMGPAYAAPPYQAGGWTGETARVLEQVSDAW